MNANIKFGTQPAHKIIEERGLTIQDVIRETGLKQGHVYQALQGRISPSQELRDHLVKILGVSVDELFTEDALAPVKLGRRQSSSLENLFNATNPVQARMNREVREFMDQMVGAVHAIAHGDVHAPGGLEGLTMAIGGVENGASLSDTVERGFARLADAHEIGMRDLADAVRELTNRNK